MTRKQEVARPHRVARVDASRLAGVVLRALAIASLVAVTTTGCQAQQDEGQEGEEEVAMGKIFSCIAVRTRSVLDAQCLRTATVVIHAGTDREEEVEVSRECLPPPYCVTDEIVRATLCIDPCPPDDPVSVCNPVKDNLQECCEDMA